MHTHTYASCCVCSEAMMMVAQQNLDDEDVAYAMLHGPCAPHRYLMQRALSLGVCVQR